MCTYIIHVTYVVIPRARSLACCGPRENETGYGRLGKAFQPWPAPFMFDASLWFRLGPALVKRWLCHGEAFKHLNAKRWNVWMSTIINVPETLNVRNFKHKVVVGSILCFSFLPKTYFRQLCYLSDVIFYPIGGLPQWGLIASDQDPFLLVVINSIFVFKTLKPILI